MIFKTELFIGEKIRGFEPQFSDLDYPAVCVKMNFFSC